MRTSKQLMMAGLIVGVLATGCAKKGIDVDAFNSTGRSLACIEENMVTYSMYESNQRLAAIDSTLACKDLYNEDARRYTKEHRDSFADIEMRLAAVKHVSLEEDEKNKKIQSEIKHEKLFGFYGLKEESFSEAQKNQDKYSSMRSEFHGLYKSYIACLDYNLALSQELSSLKVTQGQRSLIVNQCIPVVDRYLLAQGPIWDSELNPTARAESVAERRSALIIHSLQYLDGKLKTKKR